MYGTTPSTRARTKPSFRSCSETDLCSPFFPLNHRANTKILVPSGKLITSSVICCIVCCVIGLRIQDNEHDLREQIIDASNRKSPLQYQL